MNEPAARDKATEPGGKAKGQKQGAPAHDESKGTQSAEANGEDCMGRSRFVH
jgi:hypothetical protein